MKKLLTLGLILITFTMTPVGTSIQNHANNESFHSTVVNAGNITHIQLDLGKNEVEYGDTLNVKFGFLNSSDLYIGNVPYLLYLIRGVDINYTFTEPNQNTDLLLNSTSTGLEEELELDTIPNDIERLLPNTYVLYLTTNFNTTNISTSNFFEVIANEGTLLDIDFTNIETNQRIDDDLIMAEINETYLVRMVITNVGQGNALDIRVEQETSNQPLQWQFNSPSPTAVLSFSESISINFSVLVPNYGIGGITFKITYNNTLNQPQSSSKTLNLHAIPRIEGSIFPEERIYQEESVIFEVHINNLTNATIAANFQLRSSIFQFSPLEHPYTELNPGIETMSFNAFSFQNGTTVVQLFMIFIDPLGNDQVEVMLDEISVQVNQTTVVRRSNILTIIAIILYILLFLGVIILYFRKDLRKLILDRLITTPMTADLDFKNSKVIVDGSNVAWEDLDENGNPLVENIRKAIDTLRKFGFEEIIVVADAALRYQISNSSELDKMSQKGLVKVLPAKVDGDSFILRLSRDLGALILTNDLYKEYRDEFPWIDERRIPYSILNGVLYLHPLFDFNSEQENF